ncbi:histidine phosphatase family protein [Bacillus carboniphilus]|uniref:Histidine phosphatase family protein n=1 Tax=Bacillus carboniphilus TaxID=86663 RepID=A0ABN0W628_9BACI
MDIFLIRHGESEADLLHVHEGRADFSLTEKGRKQVHFLGKFFSEKHQVDQIYASPLKRAHETATTLSEYTKVPVTLKEDLMEWNNGVLAGVGYEEAKARFPEPPGGRKPYQPIEKGESDLQFRNRVEHFFYELIDQHTEQDSVAVVAHGGTISQFLKIFYQIPPVSPYAIYTGDTGVHHIRITGTAKITFYLNRQDHLIGSEF